MISSMTPASQNIRGTSAHPYHLLAGRDEKIEVIIYSYNFNDFSAEEISKIEDELNVKIEIIKKPMWFRFLFKYKLAFLRIFLKYPILNYIKLPQKNVTEIKSIKPDIIWVFCAEWSRIVKQFEGFQRIHSLPDSEALYYYRMLGQRFVTWDYNQFWRCIFMYPKYLALERDFSTDKSIYYHLVGEEDANFLKKMNPGIQARFIRHPHYSLSPTLPKREGRFNQPKIKVLIAGQYNYYMKQEADLLVQEFENSNNEELKNCYSYTFLGKEWEKHVETLKGTGYEINHITFAPDYIEEIVKHDIQITPIAIGTGTKGKVLDALANGLLVIGTPYALENIAVENGVSCIEYRQPQEVIEVLMDIPNNISKYEAMAAEGRRQVLKHHSRAKVACELFSLNCQ